jgi:hypothetical protein
MQAAANAQWIAKQDAIRFAYANMQDSINLYHAMTSNDPREHPSMGNDN